MRSPSTIEKTGILREVLLGDRYFALMIFLLIVQQTIVASSTVWLVQVVSAVQEGRAFLSPFIAYLASLVLPYFPGALAIVTSQKWELSARTRLVRLVEDRLSGRVVLWLSPSEKARRVTLFAKEGQNTLSDFSLYGYNLMSCCLNTLFNLLAVSIVLAPEFLLSYAASLLGCASLLWWQREEIERRSRKAEEARIQLSSIHLLVWDNLVLGNTYSSRQWRERAKRGLTDLWSSSVAVASFSQTVAVGAALLTLIPTFATLFYLLYSRSAENGFVLAVLVTLPRIFHILSSTHQVIALLSGWSVHRGKIEVLESLFAPVGDESLEARISYDRIRVEGNGTTVTGGAFESIAERLERHGPLRWSVTGPNGAGKSTLLALLKARHGSEAFLLPAHHDLIGQGGADPVSTGQKALGWIETLTSGISERWILLDEWDAALDAERRKHASHLIDLMVARGATVVEVSHRGAAHV